MNSLLGLGPVVAETALPLPTPLGLGLKLSLFPIPIATDELTCLGWLGGLGDASPGPKPRDPKPLELPDVGGPRDWRVSLAGLARLTGGSGEGEGER